LAVSGIAGQLVLTSGWIVAGALQPQSYSRMRQEISDLGALTATHAWVWNLADSLSGLLTALFAVGLFAALAGQHGARVGAVLIGLVGIGDLLDGLLREDCPLSTSASCRALRDGSGLSWHHHAHDVESVLVGIAAVAAPFALAYGLRRSRGWQALVPYTRVAAVAILAAIGVYLARYGHPGAGIAQRAFALAVATWIATLALQLWAFARKPVRTEVRLAP
jgi:hypothetical membrane protein